jgi:hypothetical protein
VRLAHQPGCIGVVLALHPKASELVDRLWRQADVPHDGHAGADDLPDDVLMSVDPFQLDGVRAARHECADGGHRLRYPLPGGQERQIADHELPARGPGDGTGVQRHQFDGRGKRRGMSVDDHGDGVADEDGVDVRAGDDVSRPGVVGSDDRDLPLLRLEGSELAHAGHRLPPARRWRE